MGYKPPQNEPENETRAEWAYLALERFIIDTGADYEYAICDLLCYLMHLCDRDGFDFNAELNRAKMHYEAEQNS